MDEATRDRRLTAWLAWTMAAGLVLGAAMLLLLGLNITAPDWKPVEGLQVLVDNILRRLGNEQLRWPQEVVATLAFAVAFAAVAGLGVVLPRLLDGATGRARVIGTALLLAGGVGIVGTLLYLGGKELAINTGYCECGLRDPQLISRATVLDIVTNMQTWLTDGFAVLLGIGLIAMAGLRDGRVAMSGAWRRFTVVAGAIAIAFVIASHILRALSSPEMDLSMVGLLLTIIVAGVIAPIWAIWTARALHTTD